jgi:hypothetical protein
MRSPHPFYSSRFVEEPPGKERTRQPSCHPAILPRRFLPNDTWRLSRCPPVARPGHGSSGAAAAPSTRAHAPGSLSDTWPDAPSVVILGGRRVGQWGRGHCGERCPSGEVKPGAAMASALATYDSALGLGRCLVVAVGSLVHIQHLATSCFAAPGPHRRAAWRRGPPQRQQCASATNG